MAKQNTAIVDDLTTAQLNTAKACFKALAKAQYGTGLDRFTKDVFALYCVNGIIIEANRKRLTAENRIEYLVAAKARKGSELDAVETKRANACANSTFARFAAELEPQKIKARIVRAAQSAQNVAAASAANAPGTDPLAPTPDAPANEIQKRHFAEQAAAHAKQAADTMHAMQPAMLRMPKAVQEQIGVLAEQINKVNEDCAALIALYA